MTQRSYDGPPLDHTHQYLGERPAIQDDDAETVYATDPEPEGSESTEDVPTPDRGEEADREERPDREGQTTLDDWARWSA